MDNILLLPVFGRDFVISYSSWPIEELGDVHTVLEKEPGGWGTWHCFERSASGSHSAGRAVTLAAQVTIFIKVFPNCPDQYALDPNSHPTDHGEVI